MLLSYIFALSISSALAYEPELIGAWVNCELLDKDYDVHNVVLFSKKGQETEMQILRAKTDSPCDGEPQLALTTYWNYRLEGKQLHSKATKNTITVFNRNGATKLSENKMCGHKNWKIGTAVLCDNEFDLKGKTILNDIYINESIMQVTTEENKKRIFRKVDWENFIKEF